MAHAFILAGEVHEVWLARAPSGYVMHIGDESVAVALHARGEHVHELLLGDDGQKVSVAVRGDEVHVHVQGETHLLRYSHSLERFAGEAEDCAESVSRAPMPGAVISIAAQQGQRVDRGELLMVIESMKMETAICASHDGIVQALHVAVGETFDRDTRLVTLERMEGSA
ncbi:MAG: acetyl-CoA carboxylase biotin carboxyl carrier protein subunit [Cupriavidus necator]